jgi:hypothetical protein
MIHNIQNERNKSVEGPASVVYLYRMLSLSLRTREQPRDCAALFAPFQNLYPSPDSRRLASKEPEAMDNRGLFTSSMDRVHVILLDFPVSPTDYQHL